MRLYTTSQVRKAYDALGVYPAAVLELLDLEDALATGSPAAIAEANEKLSQAKLGLRRAFADAPNVAASIIDAIGREEVRLELSKPEAPVTAAANPANLEPTTEAASRALTLALPEPATNGDIDPVVFILWFPPERLYIAPSRPFTFRREAQGRTVSGTWTNLGRFLGRSRLGDPSLDPSIAKRACGGWVGGTFTRNARTVRAFVSTMLLIVDVDGGDPHGVAEALSRYAAIIHSTYQHTPETPRCRAILRLARPCRSARDYTTGHAVIRDGLAARGFHVDDGAHDAARLNYMPMHQATVTPVHIVTTGRPLDLERLVPATPPCERTPSPSRSRSPASPSYAQRALHHAVEHAATAPAGERHNVLFREAASLARAGLALDDDIILGGLLPAAEAADPETESREHLRVIRDGIEAGRVGS